MNRTPANYQRANDQRGKPETRYCRLYEDYIKTDSVYFTARGVVIHQGGGAVGGGTGRRAALRATSCSRPSGLLGAGVKFSTPNEHPATIFSSGPFNWVLSGGRQLIGPRPGTPNRRIEEEDEADDDRKMMMRACAHI